MEKDDIKLSLSVSDKGKQSARNILNELGVHPGAYILLNISSSHPNKNTTDELIIKIIIGLTQVSPEPILLISDNAQRSRLHKISTAVNSARIKITPNMDLETITALIAKGKMVITPDTALVHIACGVGIPVAAFYTRQETFYREWLPIGVENRVIIPNGNEPVSLLDPEIALGDIIGLYRNIT